MATSLVVRAQNGNEEAFPGAPSSATHGTDTIPQAVLATSAAWIVATARARWPAADVAEPVAASDPAGAPGTAPDGRTSLVLEDRRDPRPRGPLRGQPRSHGRDHETTQREDRQQRGAAPGRPPAISRTRSRSSRRARSKSTGWSPAA